MHVSSLMSSPIAVERLPVLVDRRVDDEEAGVAVDREAEEADEPGMEHVDRR